MPIPPDGTKTARPDLDLMWLQGDRAKGHIVYFGTAKNSLRKCGTFEGDSNVCRLSASVSRNAPRCGARRIAAWGMLDRVKTDTDRREAESVLAKVNEDDKAVKSRLREAEKAFDAAEGSNSGTVHIKIMPGRYALQETFVLGMQDSGYEGLPTGISPPIGLSSFPFPH